MRLSIQRLRWVLVAGALLLIVVLAATIGYGRYRMMSAYRRILARSGVSVSRDSNGVTYSQSVGGKKIFTLRAVRETSLGNGRWALHDADLLLYTRNSDHPDHIYGKEFEYDQNEGVARALGDVYMDLQAPEALAGKRPVERQGRTLSAGPAGSEPATAINPGLGPIIHVRTSGLVYLRKLGVAATDNEVEFQYGGMQCTALGAEFNTSQNILHLLARVNMDGTAHGQPVHLTAVRADLDRTDNVANLTRPVVASGERKALADQAVLNLRADGSLEQVHGVGNVVLISGTRQVTAQRLDAMLNPQAVPQTAKLSGGVLLVDSNAQRPMHGAAKEVNAFFTAQGAPMRVVALGAAQISLVDHADPVAGPRGLQREVQGQTLEALFVPGARRTTSQLSQVQAIGAARLRAEALVFQANNSASRSASLAPGAAVKTVQVAADNLRVTFAPTTQNRVRPEQLYGAGHTLLQQDAPLDEQEISRGDTLQAVFAAASSRAQVSAAAALHAEPLTIVSAIQIGHVTIFDRAAARQPAAGGREASAESSREALAATGHGAISTGSAERAVYDAASQTVTLSGSTHLQSGEIALSAPTVELNQETGNALAKGGVETTMLSAPSSGAEHASAAGHEAGSRSSAGPRAASATHILSASASFNHDSRLSEFLGSDGQPAKIWQAASQVQAAVLTIDAARHTFSARPAAAGGLVHAVFAGSPGSATTSPASRRPEDSFVRVASPRMDYNDLLRQAAFSGGVRIDGTTGEVRGQSAVVFLAPPTGQATGQAVNSPVAAPQTTPVGGSLDRIVVSGDVRLEQPARRGSAEQLLYTAATGTYVLTGSPGHPPEIVDAVQGSITGATLLFREGGSTIVVAGTPGAKSGRGRVRTETEVRP
jgi:lipopolysaccharide export system protein LptA